MGHSHSHEVAHFRWCKNPTTCFCEVNRYILAGVIGLLAASAEIWIAWMYAGSYGAESDAGHAYADSGFIFISAVLAYWKHYDKDRYLVIDDIGIWINSWFLIIAGSYILFRIYAGGRFVDFAAPSMFGAGFVGLIGNVAQFRSLGEKLTGEGTGTHSTTRQHVFYDIMYSFAVMFSAALILVMSSGANYLWQVLVGVMLVLIASVGILRLGFVEYDSWEKAKRTDYWLGVTGAVVVVSSLVINGSAVDVDNLTAILLSVLMIGAGILNLDDRYTKIVPRLRHSCGWKDKHHHDHGNHHH
jgi:Co/Zn/Cd efflux system component